MSDDELEFQKIHEAFRPKIHRYLTHLVGEHEAEDLTQEVFVKVSRALETFRESLNCPRGYIESPRMPQ